MHLNGCYFGLGVVGDGVESGEHIYKLSIEYNSFYIKWWVHESLLLS